MEITKQQIHKYFDSTKQEWKEYRTIEVIKVEKTYDDILKALELIDTTFDYLIELKFGDYNHGEYVIIRKSKYSGFCFALILSQHKEGNFTDISKLIEIPCYHQNKYYNQTSVGLLNYILKRLKIENSKPIYFKKNNTDENLPPVINTFEKQDLTHFKRKRGEWVNFYILLP